MLTAGIHKSFDDLQLSYLGIISRQKCYQNIVTEIKLMRVILKLKDNIANVLL